MAQSPTSGGKEIRLSFAHRLQAWFLRGIMGLFGLLPLNLAAGLGSFLARTIGPLTRGQKVAKDNMKQALPELSEPEILNALNGMWDMLGRTLGEYPHLKALHPSTDPTARTQVIMDDSVRAALDSGRAVSVVAAHMGNWELGPMILPSLGVDFMGVYRALNNPLADQVLLDLRTRASNANYVPKGSKGSRQLLKWAKSGKSMGFLIDQKFNDGMAVPFFGRDAMTATAVAEMAVKFNQLLLPAQIIRKPGSRFEIVLGPPLEPVTDRDSREENIRATMVQLHGLLEDWIRENPSQWFWVHRRWPKN